MDTDPLNECFPAPFLPQWTCSLGVSPPRPKDFPNHKYPPRLSMSPENTVPCVQSGDSSLSKHKHLLGNYQRHWPGRLSEPALSCLQTAQRRGDHLPSLSLRNPETTAEVLRLTEKEMRRLVFKAEIPPTSNRDSFCEQKISVPK